MTQRSAASTSTSAPATRIRSTTPCSSRPRSRATRGVCTGTCPSRSGGRTVPISTRAGSGYCPRPPSSSSGSMAMGSDDPDEGHGAARPMVRRGRRGVRAAPGLGEGSGGERDDRGSAAQRHRPGGAGGVRPLARPVRDGAVRDRVAAHLDRGRPAPAGVLARRRLPSAVPVRIGDRCAQGLDDARSSRRSSATPAASTAERSASSRRPAPLDPAPGSTWRSGPSSQTRRAARLATAPGVASRGTRARARSTTRPWPRRGCSRLGVPHSGCSRRSRTSPVRGSGDTANTWPGSAPRPTTSVSAWTSRPSKTRSLERRRGSRIGRPASVSWSISAAGWKRVPRHLPKPPNRSAWRSTGTIPSTHPTRCSFTRRRSASATRPPPSASPTRMTSSS